MKNQPFIKNTSKLICIIFIISILFSSFQTVTVAADNGAMQNAVLTILTLSNLQRLNFISVALDNADELTFDERVQATKDDYLKTTSIADIKTILNKYDSYSFMHQSALAMFIMDGIPSNSTIGSIETFSHIASYINNEITGTASGTVNGQTNVGVRMMLKVLSTAVAYNEDMAIVHDSLINPATKIKFSAPTDSGIESTINSLIGSFESLSNKISSRPETSQLEKLFGYMEDGINGVSNYAVEMPHFKKCLRDYDSNIYDGTYYYQALPTLTPSPSVTATATIVPQPIPTTTNSPTATATTVATPISTPTTSAVATPTATPTETTTAIPTTTPTKIPTAKPTVTPRPTPKAPVVNAFDDSDQKLTGKASAGLTIFIKKRTVTIARGKVAKNGAFSLSIDKQWAGTVLTVFAENSYGLVSKITKVTVKYICPPIFDSLDSKDTYIKGHAEVGSTVKLKIKSKTLGSVAVKKDGTFALKIKALKTGTIVEGTAKDKAGHVSAAAKVTVKKG